MGSAASKRAAQGTVRQFPIAAEASTRLRSRVTAAPSDQPQAQPNRTSSAADAPPHAPAQPHTKASPSFEKSEAIMRDAQDPDFESMLRTLGAVRHTNNPNLPPQPSTPSIPSTYPSSRTSTFQSFSSNSSSSSSSSSAATSTFPTSNTPTEMSLPASLRIMRARERQTYIQSTDPASYMTVFTLREVIALRERKKTDAEIEKSLGLKKGTLERLGKSVGGVTVRDETVKEKIDFAG